MWVPQILYKAIFWIIATKSFSVSERPAAVHNFPGFDWDDNVQNHLLWQMLSADMKYIRTFI